MKPEEAYKILNGEIIYKGGRTNGKRFAMGELNRVINEALKKQIPKKPNIIDDWECYCPCCGNDFGITMEDVECGCVVNAYCDKCGQAIDWSD